MQRIFSLKETIMTSVRTLSLGALALAACSSDPAGEVGRLDIELSSRLGEAEYTLVQGLLRVEGPEPQEVDLEGPGNLELTLPVGAHRLTLEDGWELQRGSGEDAVAVEARLLSDNPLQLFVSAGDNDPLTFRFGLDDGSEVESGTGTLDLHIDVTEDAALPEVVEDLACLRGLRINEVDYDQAGTDEAEFVEIVNFADCEADLTGVSLSFINGSDGSPYGGVELGDLGALAAGARLVIGDAAVAAQIPAEASWLPLAASGLQNGPDAIWLLSEAERLDGVAYGEGAPDAEGDTAPEAAGELGLSRCPDAFDTDDNSVDLVPAAPTPGSANACSAVAG